MQDAMVDAVKQSVGSVISSGLTTVSGFAGIDSDAVSDRSGYGMGDGKGNCPQPVFRTVFPSGTDHDFL